jgi:hypothetical protein
MTDASTDRALAAAVPERSSGPPQQDTAVQTASRHSGAQRRCGETESQLTARILREVFSRGGRR